VLTDDLSPLRGLRRNRSTMRLTAASCRTRRRRPAAADHGTARHRNRQGWKTIPSQRLAGQYAYLQVLRERSGAGVEPTNRGATTACRFWSWGGF